MQLSVIIPTLNEQRLIARQVEYTAGLPGIGEVVVADGGAPTIPYGAFRLRQTLLSCPLRREERRR